MGSGGEGTVAETVIKSNSLQPSYGQNSTEKVNEAAGLDIQEFNKERTMILKRALRVGDERKVNGELHRRQLNDSLVQLDPSAREYIPVCSLPTPFIVPPSAPPPHSFYPAIGHPAQQLLYGGSQFSTGVPINVYTVPQQLNLNYMPSIVHPPVAWDPMITIQVNAAPLVSHPIQPSSTYYDSSTAPSATVQLGAIGRRQPSRTLSLSLVPTEISDAVIIRDLSAWGPIREMEFLNRQQGLVTVHYYDLRHAKAALADIQEQHMMQQRKLWNHYRYPHEELSGGASICAKGLIGGSVVWAQYTTPLTYRPDSLNQGTLVVFNLDSDISMDKLRSVFGAYGAVKEVRETPWKGHHKFVEFFDVRDAARALKEMHGQDIGGKQVHIEFSRPGGQGRTRFQTQAAVSMPNAAPRRNTYRSLQRRWNSDKEICTYPTSASSYGYVANTEVEINTEDHMCIGPGRGGQGIGLDESVHGRTGGGNGSHIKSEHSAKISMASDCRPSFAAVTTWRAAPNGKNGSHGISHFSFDEGEAASNCSKSRTTVMIKNIPNKYSQQMLLAVLDQHCASCNDPRNNPDGLVSAYDFVYLPMDFQNRCNLGYAFVNFTSGKATLKLYQYFHRKRWEAFNSRKICEVTYARVQGRYALEDHFRNSRFACDTNEYLPLAFDPPRNGSNLTDKIVMGGLEHAGNEAGENVCNNDGIVGATESDPKMPNLHGFPVQPRRQYNKRMVTSGTGIHQYRRWNNRYRSINVHYKQLNAGATASCNPEKD